MMLEKPHDDYDDNDYKVLEKISRAKKVLHSALGPGDLKKLLYYKTAKDIWDAKRLYVGQLEFLGEEIDEWKVTHHFLQSLNQKWDVVTLALQAQKDIKDISLEELAARLQSNDSIQQRKASRRTPEKDHSLALKVEKAFELSQTDKIVDEDTTLVTRALKMARIGGMVSFKGKTSPKEVICYHCQKKGHMAKDCFSKRA
ncbi:unnamed protein product [Rhodiola kirilowii]